MNLLRKTATTLGGIFFAVLLIAALAPKATRGVAAALVQVTNTASNAVPTESGPGNFPFGATLCTEFLTTADCAPTASAFLVPVTTSTGAPVKRLVIENIGADCLIGPGDVIETAIRVPLPVDNVMAGRDTLVYSLPISVVGTAIGFANSQVRIYADPGARIDSVVFGSIASGASCTMFLTGHLETK